MLDINEKKVSVIISSYNRYEALKDAIKSVKNQSHKNIEIIVINDKSSDKRYYDNPIDKDVVWINLDKSSREIYGFPSPGYVRNQGILVSKGEFIAPLDDDDYWYPSKLEIQLKTMLKKNVNICCSEAHIGDSYFDSSQTYPVYHREHFHDYCKEFFGKYYGNWDGILPDYFDLSLIEKHNFVIHSSVVINKKFLDDIGLYNENIPLREGGMDWDLWKRCLQHENILHINEPLLYYDGRLSQTKKPSVLKKILPAPVVKKLKRIVGYKYKFSK